MPGLMENVLLDLELNVVVEDTVPDMVLSTPDAALFVSVFATTARIALLNAEPDVAADLCEAVTIVGLALRGPSPSIPTAVLRRASDWAASVLDLLVAGIWTRRRHRPGGPGGCSAPGGPGRRPASPAVLTRSPTGITGRLRG